MCVIVDPHEGYGLRRIIETKGSLISGFPTLDCIEKEDCPQATVNCLSLPSLGSYRLEHSPAQFYHNYLTFEIFAYSNSCIIFVYRKKATFVIMLLGTWQCIASVLQWQPSFSCSASSCMVFVVVKIHDLEYKMASGVSRSLSTLDSLWGHSLSQVEHL